MKTLLIILDGAADLPDKHLHELTPFEAAKTPNLDFLARNGNMGLMYPLSKKIIPSSANALVSILGNDPKKCERGIYESVGAGLKIIKGNLALRTNFATIENLKTKKLIDRRAGRTLTTKEANELAKALNENIQLPCKFEFKATVQHRGALLLKGKHSDRISSVNSGWAGTKQANEFKFSEPLDNQKLSKETAKIVNDFIIQSYQILNKHQINEKRKKKGLFPANIILTRGPGNSLPKVKQYKNWMSINSMPLEIGIAKISGMENFPSSLPPLRKIDIYRYLYKILKKKINHSIRTLKRNHKKFSGCYIQIKETDIPGHDNKPHDKVKMIELIDKKFFSKIKNLATKNDWKVIVTCDHSTPCQLKGHSAHPVPVLIYDSNNIPDQTQRFNEIEARMGSLKTFYGKDFAKKTGL